MKFKYREETVDWFIEQNKLGNITLNPKYQRNPVWADDHKQYFLDTILKQLPIPIIFMRKKYDPHRKKTIFDVVDGQQRLRTIFDFVSTHSSADQIVLSKKYFPEYEDSRFKDLPNDIQKLILQTDLPIGIIEVSEDAEIQDMYQRLNKNVVKLNRQELRKAQYEGDFIQLATELAEDDYWLENKIVSPSHLRRMLDIEFISEILATMLFGQQDKKKNLDAIYAKNEKMEKEERPKARRDFERIKGLIQDIFPEIASTRFNNKSDYYSLFYALYRLDKDGFKCRDAQIIKNIHESLIAFQQEVREDSKNEIARKYHTSVLQAGDAIDNREFRYQFLRGLIEPLCIKKDPQRLFSEWQKKYMWHQSRNKLCVICKKSVTSYADYEPDHKQSWSKGGPTSIINGQITHRSCNRKKSGK